MYNVCTCNSQYFATGVCSRVVWAFGKAILHPVNDVTPTHLSQGVLATLREADYVAHQILKYNGRK